MPRSDQNSSSPGVILLCSVVCVISVSFRTTGLRCLLPCSNASPRPRPLIICSTYNTYNTKGGMIPPLGYTPKPYSQMYYTTVVRCTAQGALGESGRGYHPLSTQRATRSLLV